MKQEVTIELLKKDVKEIKNDIADLKSTFEKSFVELKKNLDDRYWAGSVDEFAFFNKVLTPTEIQNLYTTNIKKFVGIKNV